MFNLSVSGDLRYVLLIDSCVVIRVHVDSALLARVWLKVGWFSKQLAASMTRRWRSRVNLTSRLNEAFLTSCPATFASCLLLVRQLEVSWFLFTIVSGLLLLTRSTSLRNHFIALIECSLCAGLSCCGEDLRECSWNPVWSSVCVLLVGFIRRVCFVTLGECILRAVPVDNGLLMPHQRNSSFFLMLEKNYGKTDGRSF